MKQGLVLLAFLLATGSGVHAVAKGIKLRVESGVVVTSDLTGGAGHHASDVEVPVVFEVGYHCLDERLVLSLEFQYWDGLERHDYGLFDWFAMFGSFNLDYYLVKDRSGFGFFVMSGMGFGFSRYVKIEPDQGFVGPCPLQVGLGADFVISDLFSVGIEERLYLGLPLGYEQQSYLTLMFLELTWDIWK